MSKSIDNLKITELIELKTVSDFISEEYAKELTTYAETFKDPYFSNIPNDLKEKYDKRLKSKKLSEKIRNKMEKIIEEYYD